MKITVLGHAGLLVETSAGRILCDPWFNPAFYGSWVPFPDNTKIDQSALCDAEYLYISHLHHDHFDSTWLRTRMSKDTTVLLPDYPIPDLRHALEGLGFHRLIQTRNNEITELDADVRVLINTITEPARSPVGDSGLVVSDRGVQIYNQNDSRPVERIPLDTLGPLHGHFVQFTGANWYPMVYDFPERMKATLGRRKRKNGMARAMTYINQYAADHIFPFAGPACFLDDDVLYLNDFDDDESNAFPDQFAFLEFLRTNGVENGHPILPGTVIELSADGALSIHDRDPEELARVMGDKRSYILDYKSRVQPRIDEIKTAWPTGGYDLLPSMKAWIEPIMARADNIAAGINGRILLEVERAGSTEQIVLDFHDRAVVEFNGQHWQHSFRIPWEIIADAVRRRDEDWENGLFLSCRFEASRKGPFNEHVPAFFQCLSHRRIEFIESGIEEAADTDDLIRIDDRVVQRYCPHMKADLLKFGTVDDGILTCQMHGWEFEIDTGRCVLGGDDRRIATRPAGTSGIEHDRDATLPRIVAAHEVDSTS
ncbi:Rieske 2Fe-2S domain-containing protein [Nocardia sp. NPDC005978]|uniref:Rieske 2Fe-2S domain-containing protein n=1 Tax=Nocardia sp. NPDC005978 TaxID=3156725 RepID=UPI0033B9765C